MFNRLVASIRGLGPQISLGLPRDRGFILGNFLAVLEAVSAIALLGCSAWLISAAALQPPIMYLNMVIVGVRGFALGRAFFRYTQRLTLHNSAFRLQTKLRPQIISAISPMAPAGLKLVSRGEVGTQLTNDVEEIQNLGVRVLAPLVQAVLSSVLTVVALAVVASNTGAWLTLFITLAASAMAALPLSAAWNRRQVAVARMSRVELETRSLQVLENLELMQAYEWDDRALSNLASTDQKLAKTSRGFALTAGFGGSVFSLAATIAVCLSSLQAAAGLENGHLDRRMLAVVALLPLAVFEIFAQTQPAITAFQRYRESANRLSQQLSAVVPAEILPSYGAEKLAGVQAMVVHNAHFRYPSASVSSGPVNLVLEPGDTLFVTGGSGAGKTTLAYALAGFIHPVAGEVLVNGQPLNAYTESSLRERIGYLEQQPAILDGSVKANLLIAKTEATDDELAAVLDRVGLDKTFRNREGLETQLGDRGMAISGGEAQRLALARALLADFQVLIFDEPTANVDADNAAALWADLLAIATEGAGDHRRISVFITHDEDLVASTAGAKVLKLG